MVIFNTKELLKKQRKNNEFIRYDIIVRCIAVDFYLKYKKIHYLYEKDILERRKYVNSKEPIPYVESEESIMRFIKTIESFKYTKKFNSNYPLDIYLDYIIKDGIHRMATCLSLNIEYVNCNMFPDKSCLNDYPDISYYRKVFTLKELKLLVDKKKELI